MTVQRRLGALDCDELPDNEYDVNLASTLARQALGIRTLSPYRTMTERIVTGCVDI